jgi:hypothetical protein
MGFDAIRSPEETAALLKKQRDAAVGSKRRSSEGYRFPRPGCC